jgi:GDP-L-fucose synthase
MPTNLYGPNDNFSPQGSHVLPALIRRYSEAVQAEADKVVNWGSGSPRREFLHVDDMADACLYLLERYDGPQQVNVGTGADVTIREIAETIASITGFHGQTVWDTTKPDGTPQKLLDVSMLAGAGWTARIGLEDGLRSTIKWFHEHQQNIRSHQ